MIIALRTRVSWLVLRDRVVVSVMGTILLMVCCSVMMCKRICRCRCSSRIEVTAVDSGLIGVVSRRTSLSVDVLPVCFPVLLPDCSSCFTSLKALRPTISIAATTAAGMARIARISHAAVHPEGISQPSRPRRRLLMRHSGCILKKKSQWLHRWICRTFTKTIATCAVWQIHRLCLL